MMFKHQIKTVLLLILLIIWPFNVNSQSCTIENPCPKPEIKEVGIGDMSKVTVSSNCTGTYNTPEGVPNLQCPVFDVSVIVDKKTLQLGGETFEVEVLDTFWISANSYISPSNYQEESIEYDFVDRFLVRSFDLIFRGPSAVSHDMRPKAMKFQGKNELGEWVDWGYYAEDCVLSYNKQPTDFLFNTQPQCTHRDAVNPPAKNGGPIEVGFRPIEYFKEGLYNNPDIYKFFTTSAIKIIFNTPPITDNPDTTYYVVADLNIAYQCACFGHGSVCGGQEGGECTCLHKTGGKNCQECLPLYNNLPWQMALTNSSFDCLECTCNNRSLSCVYDSIELDGRCDQCLYNTTGRHCESCEQNFYLNPQAGTATGTCTGQTDIGIINYDCGDVCIPCNCSLSGSQSIGTPCDAVSGQCVCKVNVEGRACDVCKDGFYLLDITNSIGCSQCDCDQRGMVSCDKFTGACQCKIHTIEPNCIGCEIGYYNFSGENPEGCTYCDCEIGRSTQQTCDLVNGNCICRQGTGGRDCRGLIDTFFAPHLDLVTFEAEYALNISNTNLVQRPGGGEMGSSFTGRGFYKLTQPIPPLTQHTITLAITLPVSSPYQIIIRYESEVDFPNVVSSIASSLNLSTSGLSDNVCINATDPQTSTASIVKATASGFSAMTPEVCLTKNLEYLMTLTFQGSLDPTKEILVDSVVFLPVINQLGFYLASIDSVKTQMTQCLTSAQQATFSLNKTTCTSIGNSLMVDLNKAAYPCQCDLMGSVDNQCEGEGGQCQCKSNVFLRNCSQCQLYSYGFQSNNGCMECSCHVNGSMSLICTDAGVCECKVNVTGSKCDRCLDKHYGLFTGEGCKPCSCGGIYVSNDSCLDSGQCLCKPGVGGLGCDECAIGFYGLTDDGCSSCGCDVDGSANVACQQMAGGCQCKTGVEGPQCDTCKTGFYGLGPYTSNGCLTCFCSGHSTNCTSAQKWFTAVSESQWNVMEGDVFGARWSGLDGSGSAINLQKQVYLNDQRQVLRIVNTLNDTSPSFFVSPTGCHTSVVTSPNITASTSCFNGYKAPSYGQSLRFTIAANSTAVITTPNPSPNATTPPLPPVAPIVNFPYPEGDVVINGVNSIVKLVTNLPSLPNDTPIDYSIKLNEENWFKNSVSLAVRPTFAEMMSVLYNVESIYIRSKFSNVVGSVAYLFKVEMEYAVDKLTGQDKPASNVELCVCPEPYEGRYCEKCSFGFTKSKLVAGDCVPCDCNSHEYPGTSCDPETGVCNCSHHATGSQCELCLEAYYGDAKLGQPDSCKACLCPGDITNPSSIIPVHSTTKNCTNSGATSFACECDSGYVNDMCDVCADGFYGQPNNSSFNGGICTQCDCNNYNDDKCDNHNGTCLACGGNTTGFGCRQCLPKHYSSDLLFTKRCLACGCDGAASLGCNNQTGACDCQSGVALETGCKECTSGYYNFTSNGCKDCNCYTLGTVASNPNCSSTGECVCGANFEGGKCDSCTNTTYGSDCGVDCNCLTDYTVNGDATCNITNGQCHCLQGFTGNTCDTCLPYAGKAYEGIKEVIKPSSVFPNCSSCGQCFDDIATKSSGLNLNLTVQNTMLQRLKNLYYPSVDPKSLASDLDAIRASFLQTNASNQAFQDLVDIRNNISFFNTETRITEYQSRLSSFNDNKEALDLAMIPLRQINSDNLETGNPLKPVLSLTNVKNTLTGLIDAQKSITSEAEAAYETLKRHDTLVKNLPTAINGLTLRVTNANSSLASIPAFLETSEGQLDAIKAGGFRNAIIRADFYQKTVTSEVDVLAEDLTTARYYSSVSTVMYQNGSQQLIQLFSVYSTLNTQFSPTSNISRMTAIVQDAAEVTSRNVGNFCNSTEKLQKGVVYLMTNLSDAKERLDAPTLTQYDTTMSQIGNTNIDEYSNQIGSLASSILNQAVPTEEVRAIGQLANSSSNTGKSLTGTIQLAVNDTQAAKTGLEGLQSNLQTATTSQRDSQNCLDTLTNDQAYIKSTIVFIQDKAKQTAAVAVATEDALLNNTNSTGPIKAAFQGISNDITNSLNSIQLSNISTTDVQNDLTSTVNRVPGLLTSVVDKKAEYDRWKVTKGQLETCVNELWTSFNALNQPVSINALMNYTNSQSLEIQQLTAEIDNLQKELEALQSTLENVAKDGISCKNILPS